MDFEELRRIVENEISAYEYTVTSGAIGRPIPSNRIAAELATMRSALVAPYWADVDIRDTFEQSSSDIGPRQRCAVVADDGRGSLLLFDPTKNDFLLALRRESGLRSVGVRGDAVGCFIAR
jgi:hypothetical protein